MAKHTSPHWKRISSEHTQQTILICSQITHFGHGQRHLTTFDLNRPVCFMDCYDVITLIITAAEIKMTLRLQNILHKNVVILD